MYILKQPAGSKLWWKGSEKKWLEMHNLVKREFSLARTVKHAAKAHRLFESMPDGSIMWSTKSRKVWIK